jgi:hypothetical protein
MPRSTIEIDLQIKTLELELLRLKQLRNTIASPFLAMPAELILKVLHATHPATLYAVSWACSTLRNISLSIGKLWVNVDVCQIRNPHMFPELIRRIRGEPLRLTSGAGKSIPKWLGKQMEDNLNVIACLDVSLLRGRAARKLWALGMQKIRRMRNLQQIVLTANADGDYENTYSDLICRSLRTVRSIVLEGLEFFDLVGVKWPLAQDIRISASTFHSGPLSLIYMLSQAPLLESLVLECNVYQNIAHEPPERLRDYIQKAIPMTHLRSLNLSESAKNLATILSTGLAPSHHLDINHLEYGFGGHDQGSPGDPWSFLTTANSDVLTLVSKWWTSVSLDPDLPAGRIEVNYSSPGTNTDGRCRLHIEQASAPERSLEVGPSLSYKSHCFIKQSHPYLAHITTLQINFQHHHIDVYIGDDINLSLLSGLQYLVIADATRQHSTGAPSGEGPPIALAEIWEWLHERKSQNRALDTVTFRRCDNSMRLFFDQVCAANLALNYRWFHT